MTINGSEHGGGHVIRRAGATIARLVRAVWQWEETTVPGQIVLYTAGALVGAGVIFALITLALAVAG